MHENHLINVCHGDKFRGTIALAFGLYKWTLIIYYKYKDIRLVF